MTDFISRRSLCLAGLGALIAAPPATAGILDEIIKVVNPPKGGGSGDLTNSEIIAGLKEALSVGTSRAIAKVGRKDGYFKDNLIRIRLPKFLSQAQSALKAIGQSELLDDLELRLNRAAETAAPYAKKLFVDAIKAMTIEDAVSILRGPENSATLFFQGKMTPTLKTTFRPILNRELESAGAIKAFDKVVAKYASIPLVPALGADAKEKLIEHGLDGALNGLFTYLGKEEAAIRRDPAKRTSEILKKVFK